MSTKTTMGNQSGHSNSPEVNELSSELKLIDSRDYSEKAHVYKIRGARTRGGWLPMEIGEATRALINEAVRIAYLMDKSCTPLPLQLVISNDEKMLYCGKRFEIEKDVSDSDFGRRIELVMSQYGVGFFSVMRDDWAPFMHISFGRGNEPEYLASVHYSSSSIDEEVF